MIPIAKVVMGDAEKKAVMDVLDSGCLSNGEQTMKFEEEFAHEMGADYGVAVCNGTIALSLALRALDVHGRVAVPALSFIATAASVVNAGCEPVFVDINAETFNIDAVDLKKKIDGWAMTVLPVALYGQSYDVDAVESCCRDSKIVQDLAQAHGSEFDGTRLGAFGDISCYSFYATKNITTGGEGGMVTTNDKKVHGLMKMLVNQGQSEKYIHPVLGYNYRMTEMQAAIGRVQLSALNIINRTRMRNADRLSAACESTSCITPPFVDKRCKHTCHMFTCLTTKNRDALVEEFKKASIDARPVYPMPMYRQESMKTFKSGPCKNAEMVCKRGFHLPVHQHLQKNELGHICEVIRELGR